MALTSNGQVTEWDNTGASLTVPSSLHGVTAIAAGDNKHALAIVGYLAPKITTQPTSHTTATGRTVSYTAAATGNPTPTVAWQVSTDGGKTYAPIVDATTTTLKVTANADTDGNRYQAVFTNLKGTATTDAATLTSSATSGGTTSAGSSSAPAAPAAPAGGGTSLPNTGASVATPLIAALVLIGAGGALTIAATRRRTRTARHR
jgi:LPXTG-motif cell wall-anchored protein